MGMRKSCVGIGSHSSLFASDTSSSSANMEMKAARKKIQCAKIIAALLWCTVAHWYLERDQRVREVGFFGVGVWDGGVEQGPRW